MAIRITDTTIQIINEVVGKALPLELILTKAIIPVTTTMMVRSKGILRDSFTICSFPASSVHKIAFLAVYPSVVQL
jgi:hypothetical protein